MSQFFAEAEVLIRPNTTGFAAQLVEKVNAEILAAQAAIKPMVVGVVGTGGLAASSALNAEAVTAEGAAVQKTTAATADLGRVSEAAAMQVTIMTGALEKAAVITTVLGRASAVHAGAVKAAAASQEVFAAALQTSNAELQAAAALGTFIAGVNERIAYSAQLAAVGEKDFAAALASVRTGAIATTAGMLGLRGAVLTAGTAFITTVIGLQVLKKSVGEASALNEEINKTEVVFKKSSTAILEWSKTTARSMGIARVEALTAANQFGNILVPLGVLPQRAAILSESLVRLASDMASFNNVSPERALNALQSGLVGQSRPLRVLGVQLTAARVQMEAMRETGKKQASEITQQDKVLARYTLILKDSAIQAGDFAATQDRLANSSRILRAQLIDLGSQLGGIVTPLLTSQVRGLNALIGGLQDLAVSYKDVGPPSDRFSRTMDEITKKMDIFLAGGPLALVGSLIGNSTKQASTNIEDMNARLKKMQDNLKGVTGPAGVAALSIQLQDLIAAFARGGPAGKQFATVLAGILADLQTGKLKLNAKFDLVAIFDQAQAREEVARKWGVVRDSIERDVTLLPTLNIPVKVNVTLDLRTAAAQAAGPSAALAEAKRQQAEALKNIRALLGLDPNASRAEINAAIQSRKIVITRQSALGRAFDELSRADAVISAAATKAATDAETAKNKQQQAAERAARAQADATQAFIDGFLSGKETLLRRRLDRAGLTETIADDLRINEGIRRVLRARLKAIQDRIRNLHLHGDALKTAKAAIAALSDQIAALNVTIDDETAKLAEQRTAARQAIIDAQQAHLEKMVTIAQTTPGTADDLKRLNALKAFLTKQIKALEDVKKKTREQKAQLDDYLVALAQTNESIRNIVGEKKKGDTFAQQAFAFLQTQQGFVSNLLGNLIPFGATSGLVGGQGGGAPTIPAQATVRQVAGGFEQPRGVNFTAGEAVRTRPPSGQQAERQIDWLRKIYAALVDLKRGSEHPEAKNQRASGAAAMDYARSGMGMGIG